MPHIEDSAVDGQAPPAYDSVHPDQQRNDIPTQAYHDPVCGHRVDECMGAMSRMLEQLDNIPELNMANADEDDDDDDDELNSNQDDDDEDASSGGMSEVLDAINLLQQQQDTTQCAPEACGGPLETSPFKPPMDLFLNDEAGKKGFLLQLALPGVKKEDVSVSWDADNRELTVSGHIGRPFNPHLMPRFYERKMGAFERKVPLPSMVGHCKCANHGKFMVDEEGNEIQDEVVADGITADMEDGVLTVSVPVVGKKWTPVKKVAVM